ncbi:MAG: hypothetical protein NVSMB51_08010 [Solirubrobacteraceae bacterium]
MLLIEIRDLILTVCVASAAAVPKAATQAAQEAAINTLADICLCTCDPSRLAGERRLARFNLTRRGDAESGA